MRKLRPITLSITAIVAVVAAVGIVAGTALAGSAHFVGTPSISISGNTLTASGKVAGLGNIPQIHVTLTADVQCVNPGDNKPKADNKTSVGAGGDFPVQNGKANFSLTGTATLQPTCSGPMTLVWTNIVLTVSATDGTFLQFTDPGPYSTSG
jgi:hypothetical protein